MEKAQFYGTGKRKTSTARVFLMPGSGQIVVNHVDFQHYFPKKAQQMLVTQPLELTESLEKFDVYVNVKGGGVSGQAGAIRLGLSRALVDFDSELRLTLKKAGCMKIFKPKASNSLLMTSLV